MADKPLTSYSHIDRKDHAVGGHAHCQVCGSCLLHGDQLHKCPGDIPISLDILAVFYAESHHLPASSIQVPAREEDWGMDWDGVSDSGRGRDSITKGTAGY